MSNFFMCYMCELHDISSKTQIYPESERATPHYKPKMRSCVMFYCPIAYIAFLHQFALSKFIAKCA